MHWLMNLPTFIIAGERKCGTGSLAKWMEMHPEIYMHPKHDQNYFLEEEIVGRKPWLKGEADGEQWERSHSLGDYASRFNEGRGYSAIGEKSADLFFWRPAHGRMARYLPKCRFIITLRNPVQRAWSHYWNEVGKGRETLSFEDALASETKRIQESAYTRNHLSYLTRGYYDVTLQDFFHTISPSRVVVITLEQTIARPHETLRKIYEFIDVEPKLGHEGVGMRYNKNWTLVPRRHALWPGVQQVGQVYNRIVEGVVVRLTGDTDARRKLRRYAKLPFQKPASTVVFPQHLKAKLAEIYAPHIQSLESMLGRDFSEWK